MSNRILTLLVVVLAIVATSAVTMVVGKSGEGAINKEEVEKVIATFLTDNPEVIVEAFSEAQRRQEAKAAEDSEKTIKERSDELVNDATTPQSGSKDANVNIVMFSDYNCGFCKRVMPDVARILEENDDVRFIHKDMPILGERSVVNAKAAVAAYYLNPDKWLAFHTEMLLRTPRNDDQLFALAEKQGIDKEALKKEMESAKVQERLQKNIMLGQAVGVRGTPAFIINGEFIRGAVGYDQLNAIVKNSRENS